MTAVYPPPAAPVRPAPSTPRLRRAASHRFAGGVARGLSEHLGVEVLLLRVAFVALAFFAGLGIALYAAFWIFVPQGAGTTAPPPRERGRERHQALALIIVLIAATMLTGVGATTSGSKVGDWIWPLLVAGPGVILLWRQADESQRNRWFSLDGRSRVAGALRTFVGATLVLAGLVFFSFGRGGLGDALAAMRGAGLLLVGLLVIFGPYLLRQTRELGAERRARIRAQERAEVAAHVHDSVLHTLTLIQRQVDDPREVARLARAQERELRAWLYRPDGEEPDRTFAAALRSTAAEVEDAHGVSIEVVSVGDCPVDDKLAALLAAAREAMVNAAKYAGGAAISVFGEADEDMVTVFVRDRGPGFDPDAVPADRLGVRESVLGRMRRNGGAANIRSEPGEGTEVELEMRRAEAGRAAVGRTNT
ncbi:PspC domain-containing protein [Embleya sp. NBC_00888]|uniref:ATP-binding protein n=1 Tax=Embleya sp. NBC_00888 TaxID=2975960 RepID=UPI003868355B|nr:PspC domain-containing protein [Embleya sp. NBC_00888]